MRVINAIPVLRRENPELFENDSGRFSGRSTRIVGMHYSPVIKNILRERKHELLERQAHEPPEHWLSSGLVGAIYDVSVSKAQRDLLEQTGGDPALMGSYASTYGGGRKGLFYSPEAVERYVASKGKEYIPPDQAPPNWVTVDNISTPQTHRAFTEALGFVATLC